MRVWDFPLRLFHWSLFISIVGAIVSVKADVMWLHERFGLTVLGLITFRIFWGFLGGHYAQFRQFLTLPPIAFQELKTILNTKPKTKAGHSAIGGYATLALLGIPLFMAISGTMSNDDILFEGPLAHLVPNGTDAASSTHRFGENFLLFIVFLHVSAIVFYKYKHKRNLTSAMVTGNADDVTVRSLDGSISTKRKFFGIFLMLVFIAAAQSILLLRPSLF